MLRKNCNNCCFRRTRSFILKQNKRSTCSPLYNSYNRSIWFHGSTDKTPISIIYITCQDIYVVCVMFHGPFLGIPELCSVTESKWVVFNEGEDTGACNATQIRAVQSFTPSRILRPPRKPIRSGVRVGATLERSPFKSHGRGWRSRIPTRSRHLHTTGWTTLWASRSRVEFCPRICTLYLCHMPFSIIRFLFISYFILLLVIHLYMSFLISHFFITLYFAYIFSSSTSDVNYYLFILIHLKINIYDSEVAEFHPKMNIKLELCSSIFNRIFAHALSTIKFQYKVTLVFHTHIS